MYPGLPEENRMAFWDVTDNPRAGGDNLVLDNWRHRQVTYTSNSSMQDATIGGNAMRGMSGRGPAFNNNSFDMLQGEMDRNRTMDSLQLGRESPNGQRAVNGSGFAPNAVVNLGSLHVSQGAGVSGLPLDANPGSSLQQQRSVAEMSTRRGDAVNAAFRRIDPRGQGYTTAQDLASAMNQYTNLSSSDQHHVIQGISGNSPHRITFAQFLSYYQVLGSKVERDRDFEDLIRHHWGFPEVCDILDDMKNKFMMVGLAYTFRRGLEQGVPELSEQAFQQAISQVGMQYSATDVRRVFDSFDPHGGGNPNPTLEVLKLTSHLTSAPKPPTPMPALYGTAHFSEVNSPANTMKPSALPGYSGYSSGASGNHYPEPSPAPPEDPEISEHDNPNAPPPMAPPEDQDEGVLAPSESIGNPNEPPPQAPPEDEDGDVAPEEEKTQDDNDGVMAPMETSGHSSSSTGYPVGQPSMGGGGKPSIGHVAASAAAGNTALSGRRRAVTIGVNYIGTRNQLAGCINDSDVFIKMLTNEFGFQVTDIRQLRDDHPQRMPTRKNITASLNWLVNGARPGDHLFFHYSGHGSQQADTSHDERDGKDETIVPCDFQSHGMITDDDLRRMIVLPLPKGCRATVIMDCCHSGTAMDLPYTIRVDSDGESARLKKKPAYRGSPSDADVVMISGCMDKQTSADIGAGSAGNDKAAGAMTTAFKTVMEKDACISFMDVIIEMRRFLKSKGFRQVPQLSSERFLNLSECFMPEVEAPTADPPASLRSPMRKALTIGINYLTLAAGRGRLAGCINDSETMVGVLKDTWGFQESQIRRLRDDRANMMPTKANILEAMRWLVQGSANGDELFLHYSGHGGQQRDRKGDERDGKDETILPCDFQSAGQITDDDLHELLVDNLPQGARLWAIMDCCHSGSALDLDYKITMSADGSVECKKKSHIRRRRAMVDKQRQGEVIMISGCKDSQTSADIGAGSMGVAKAAGAMTTAFRHTMTQNITCEDLLTNMRAFLKRNNFDQVPQMSSDKFVQLDASFAQYQEKKRGKRELPPGLVGGNAGMSQGGSPVPVGYPLSPAGGGAVQMAEDYALSNRLNMLEQEIAQLRQTSSPQHTGIPMLPPGSPMQHNQYGPAGPVGIPTPSSWGGGGFTGGMPFPQ